MILNAVIVSDLELFTCDACLDACGAVCFVLYYLWQCVNALFIIRSPC